MTSAGDLNYANGLISRGCGAKLLAEAAATAKLIRFYSSGGGQVSEQRPGFALKRQRLATSAGSGPRWS